MGERLPRREAYKAAHTHSLNLHRHAVGKARANFTSKDDKLEAGQTREGVLSSEKSELPKGRKSASFIGKLSCDSHMTSHMTFLFLVLLLNISCGCHVIGYNTFLFLVTLLNIFSVTVM